MSKKLFAVDVVLDHDTSTYIKVADDAEEAMDRVSLELLENGETFYGVFPREISIVDGYEIILRIPDFKGGK